ncbi:MAG: type IV-A pilus assembly ATPase PilB [Gammaproteobacteria bacterium RIFCSPLOWO2_01_FULL_47_190]|nr:MAG: type IV-A pilus assembly ATPase PilB [Gammaproteobacteria bacterium RIFCSPLOWO2_01_FULL_47_190]OGT83081.1 MAG: type IV-A pilus assembly ATPase PilB [Gammaproteobacteria bacterium RIFCSPLOWO2_12_FULL_47_76]
MGGLARKLVMDGLLDEATAQQAFQSALREKTPFVSYLVTNKLAPSNKIALAASQEFGVPLLDINALELDPDITKLIKEDLIKKHHSLPIFKRGKRLNVAVSDPTNLQALDEIKFAVGMGTDAILVEEDKLAKAIDKALEAAEDGLGNMEDDDGLEGLDDLDVADDSTTQPQDDSEIDDAPVVRFVNKVMLDAIKKGASDLHFEPYEKIYRVRFRIDGVLEEVARPPLILSQKIAARIKVMSRLDVSERRVPQDGRIKLKLSKSKSIDFRVSTCPTLFGEKAVLRILNSDAAALQIDQLGYEDFQKELFLKNLNKPYGMFLVTGPTGSGKTVSLYSGINILNQADVNISTAEDPVEINLPGVNQVQIDERTGMTFPKALKAFLRQDPDIILVGEIRDLETGSIAVKAAQTGHMVMSTLHTNDGPQTLTRLQDMGIQAFAVATSINLITGQRLCRKLHPDYRVKIDMPKEAMVKEGFREEWIEKGITIYGAGDGGAECPSGYKGRAGIYQVLPISDAMKRLIIEGANAVQLADQALKEGIWDLRTSGLKKVVDGITSLAEVNRVTIE